MKPELVVFHKMPIYPVVLELCATDDIVKSQKNKRRIRVYGNGPILHYRGLVWYTGSNIAILLSRDSLTHEVIAHEVFHATHHVLEFCGTKYDKDNDEPFAYLCGYLTEFVYETIKQWKLKVK